MKHINGGLACYPKSFFGYVVSPHKICFQYTPAEVKLRNLGNDLSMLPKDPQRHTPVAHIGVDNVGLQMIAVGHELPVLMEMHKAMIKAMKEHIDMYGPQLMDHLLEIRDEINK